MSRYRFKPGKILTSCLLMVSALGLVACGDDSSGLAANLPATLAVSIATPVPSPTTALTPNPPVTSPTTRPAQTLFVNPKEGKSPLAWAELLVQNIQPANTTYDHTGVTVTWAGQAGATTYTSHTDCSGFVMALLSQTYNLTPANFQRWLKTARPLAENFYAAINNRHGFEAIGQVAEIQPGDFIAIRYPPGNTDVGDDTGHIMLGAGLPQAYSPGQPNIKNTRQWEVPVIDSSESGHGKTDTRRKPDGTFGQGVGQGIFRLYTDNAGKPVGYAWSIFDDSVYYDQASRPLDIGRLDPNFKLG
jgi:hypothetical protein